MSNGQLFEPQDPKLWEPDLPPPSDEEHEALLADPEAREARRAARLGTIALPTYGQPRGRRREDISSPGQLSLEYPTEISQEAVRAVAKVVEEKQPLFDKFNRGYRVLPTKAAIDRYVLDLQSNTPKREENRTPEERRQALLRKPHNIGDNLQRQTLAHWETASLRLWSVAAVQHAIRNGQPIDSEAGLAAADAIYDFGNTLLDPKNKKLLEAAGLLGHADTIKFIGEKAQEDTEILRANPDLLRLVRIEQKKRKEYWSERHQASMEHLSDGLTKAIRENSAKNDQEVQRLEALIRGE